MESVSEKPFDRLGIRNLRDLIMHIPRKVIQSRVAFVSDINEEDIGETVFTISVKVADYNNDWNVFSAECEDEEGSEIKVVFFGDVYYATDLLRKHYEAGERVYISGKITESTYDPANLQMVNPKVYTYLPSTCQVVYPLTEGITSSKLAAYIKAALNRLINFSIMRKDWLCPIFIKQKSWPSLSASLRALHNPRTSECLHPSSKHRERLAFDELVSYFIAKLSSVSTKDYSVSLDDTLTKNFLDNLPFRVSF